MIESCNWNSSLPHVLHMRNNVSGQRVFTYMYRNAIKWNTTLTLPLKSAAINCLSSDVEHNA